MISQFVPVIGGIIKAKHLRGINLNHLFCSVLLDISFDATNRVHEQPNQD